MVELAMNVDIILDRVWHWCCLRLLSCLIKLDVSCIIMVELVSYIKWCWKLENVLGCGWHWCCSCMLTQRSYTETLTWILTGFSGSTVMAHKAGSTRVAHSFGEVYSCVARNELMPAIRAGGKGSRKARRNADTSTFCRVYNVWGEKNAIAFLEWICV